jgi:hypothetical protein
LISREDVLRSLHDRPGVRESDVFEALLVTLRQSDAIKGRVNRLLASNPKQTPALIARHVPVSKVMRLHNQRALMRDTTAPPRPLDVRADLVAALQEAVFGTQPRTPKAARAVPRPDHPWRETRYNGPPRTPGPPEP